MYCIYRITNKINNKTYIGQHKYKDLSIDEYMGSGKYLWNAYTKYGIENFEKEILISEVKTKEEINKLEIEYIRLERESGHGEYNIKDGGVGGWLMNDEIKKKISETLKGRPHTEEVRRKISETLKGRPRTEEVKKKIGEGNKGKHLTECTRRKISESRKGESHYFYGKHHSEESKRKMSESTRISQLGKKYYTNGIKCHRYIPGTEPEGYILGKLPKIKENKS